MAVANTKATAVSNADATPVVITPAYLAGGSVKERRGVVEVAAADDDGSVYRVARIRSSDVISDILLANDAISVGAAYNVGLYKTAAAGGAAVDDNLFASLVDLAAASPFRSVMLEATATNLDKTEKRVWELLGLTEDPVLEYDLALTGATAGTAAATLAVIVRYLDGNA